MDKAGDIYDGNIPVNKSHAIKLAWSSKPIKSGGLNCRSSQLRNAL